MKKQLILVLVLLMLGSFALTACQTPGNKDESTAEITTEAPPEQPAVLNVVIDGKTDFEVVYPDNANEAISMSTVNLNKRLRSKKSKDFLLNTDLVSPISPIDNDKPEILIGRTNRQASIDFIESLDENSYGVRITDKKIVIAGKTDALTVMALYVFDNAFLYEPEYTKDNNFIIPVGVEKIFTSSKLNTQEGILKSSQPLIALVSNFKTQTKVSSYNASQGAATDGTYFYHYVMKKVNGVEVGVIVKKQMSDFKTVKISAEMQLDHGNDMCYNSKKHMLVVTNMVDKKISYINPDTLELISTETVEKLPGVPWAISYNEKRDCYTVASGGRLLITDTDFNEIKSFSMPSVPYTGQGMDSDDNFIYMPRSASKEQGTNDNLILLFDWETGFKKTIVLTQTIESETMINYGDKHYVSYNTGGYKVSEVEYSPLYK